MKINKFKKVISAIMLILMLFSVVQPVFAASGSGRWTGGQFGSNMKTTDNQNTAYGVLIRKLVNTSTGEGKTVFCAEHGVDFTTNVAYNGTYYTPTNSTIRRACKIAYLGWYRDNGDYVIDGGILAASMENVKKSYVYTQQYIWETLGQSSATFINSTYQAEYQAFKDRINNEINQMQTRPSFNGQTITITAGDSKTITDTNGVLANYNSIDVTQDGIRYQHSAGSNSMTITVSDNVETENIRISDNTFQSWGMVKGGTEDHDTTVYFEFASGVQDQLYAMNYNDPVTLNMVLKIDLLGNLELKKLESTGSLVDGAIYNVSNSNGYNQDVEVKNGKITLEKLRKGIYTVKEKQAPEGYLLDTKSYNVEIIPNQTVTQDITNSEPTGTITIIKRDKETGATPQGDAKLKGAVYEVYAAEDIYNKARTKKFYSNGDLIATRTMDEKGATEDVTELPLGKYIVKEKTAGEGYFIDNTEYHVTLSYKDQNTKVITDKVTSNEQVKKMGLHIFKSGINIQSGLVEGLEGAEFTIKLNSAVERAYSQGYTYAEVWGGIDENGNTVSVDSKRVAQAQVIAPSYEIITTDSEGNAYTQNKLPYGKYIVKETKTPTDFEAAVDFSFSITKDESEIKEVAQKVKHLVVNDEQLESYIKLIKKDKKSNKIVTLNSATFEIKAASDIIDRGNGKTLYRKGDKITQKLGSTTYTSFTTNADNEVIPDYSYNSDNDGKGITITPLSLPVGKYEITEIKIPTGFLQLDTPVTFEIKNVKDYDTDKDGDFIKEVIIKNEQPTGTLKIDKTVALRENVDTSLVNISDLSKIQFKLTAKENIIDMADGSYFYDKGQEVGTYNLNKDGTLTVENLPMGVYELEEIKTLEGLVLNKEKYEVKFVKQDDITKVYTETREISNDTTLVEFSKTDITGEKELEGAKLTVLEGNKIIDTWTSSEETHKIEGLVVGKEYILREEITPDGYVKATDIKFQIKDTNEIQKVHMIDKIVTMSKTDISGEELEGAELKVTDLDGNIVDNWTSTKEAHNIKGLEEGKSYILYEDYAPEGFVISNKVEFTVTTDKETQKIEMIDKVVEILKVDVAGEELEGATLTVTSNKTKNIIDKWTSSSEPHKVSGLIEGESYTLHEEIALDGYVKASSIEFTVTTDKETQKIKMIDKIVEITKTDLVTGEELEGAELEVLDKETGETIDKWTSTKESHRVTGLEENKTYILREITAPYGFELTEEIEFTVTDIKENQKIEMKDMPILKNVKVQKIDAETKDVIKDKFIFAIYEDAECTKLIKEVKSNKEEGIALFEELRYGTYFIKEIKAPKNYQLSNRVVKVEINDKGIFVDNELTEEVDNTITFSFENQKIEVPKTGDESHIKLAAGILILSLIGIIYLIVKTYKDHKYNKNK